MPKLFPLPSLQLELNAKRPSDVANATIRSASVGSLGLTVTMELAVPGDRDTARQGHHKNPLLPLKLRACTPRSFEDPRQQSRKSNFGVPTSMGVANSKSRIASNFAICPSTPTKPSDSPWPLKYSAKGARVLHCRRASPIFSRIVAPVKSKNRSLSFASKFMRFNVLCISLASHSTPVNSL